MCATSPAWARPKTRPRSRSRLPPGRAGQCIAGTSYSAATSRCGANQRSPRSLIARISRGQRGQPVAAPDHLGMHGEGDVPALGQRCSNSACHTSASGSRAALLTLPPESIARRSGASRPGSSAPAARGSVARPAPRVRAVVAHAAGVVAEARARTAARTSRASSPTTASGSRRAARRASGPARPARARSPRAGRPRRCGRCADACARGGRSRGRRRTIASIAAVWRSAVSPGT